MAFTSNRGTIPQTPTLPTGVQIASFDTYLEAQRAVDLLSDKEFEVQHTTIVGTDLRMVERITGRLSYPRVVLAGAMSGAWFGLFVGLIFGLLSGGSIFVMLLPALIIGAAFGILFALVSYAFTGGKRDFTSSSQVVAGKYALLCEQSRVGEAMRLLNEAGIRARIGGDPQAGPARGHTQPGPAVTPPHGAQRPTYGAQPPPPGAQTPPHPAPPAPYGTQAPPRSTSAAEQPAAGATSGRPAAPSSSSARWEDEHGNPLYGQRRPAEPPEADGEGERA